MSVQKKKLIEVALPLEAINRESAREKSIRHGHPSTLHLWWARRPLAAARAVLFAQLVDDPSSHPDKFPTEEDQRIERERLHRIIERLVVWENIKDEALYAEAHAEILASTDGNPPPILDPFAGGGTIPLEAQRLGLEAHASDLNPVAVLINKALIEIPPKFRDQPPVFPGLAGTRTHWKGAEGLAADVRAYGACMRDEAEKRIGHLYPKATLPDGTKATVIAWIWARTVACPNPACGIEMPLVRSWWLGKKKGKEAYIVPQVVNDPSEPSKLRVEFEVAHQPAGPQLSGTIAGGTGVCVACDTSVTNQYIREQASRVGLGTVLMATVSQGHGARQYLPATRIDALAAHVERPAKVPEQVVPTPNHDVDRLPMYGMPKWSDAFTNRQLQALTAFVELVGEVRAQAASDGTQAHGDAIATYLGLAVSRVTDYLSSLAVWSSHPKNELIQHVFGRQAIPMAWDFAEANPLTDSSGSLMIMAQAIEKAVSRLPASGIAYVSQRDARRSDFVGLISTDPPYYDNISYSDLSDYFYVWLRDALRNLYPELLGTVLVPKAEELTASSYRHGGKAGAKAYFEAGFKDVFASARKLALKEFPITVFYAFKQTEINDAGKISTGWETLLDGMIESGWSITSTWPVRTESSARLVGQGANALGSSIVLSLRPRDASAPTTDRRSFIGALEAELPNALRTLQQGVIAPVDLPQAAIGPGMAVFSRFRAVVEADGSTMTVRSALARINEVLDQVLNEQEGDFDRTTRFAISWYRQHGYNTGKYSDAELLANARVTSVDVMDRDEILTSRAGKVALIKPIDLPSDYDVSTDLHISAWEALHHLIKTLECDGIAPAGDFLRAALARDDGAVEADLVKELAFLLFDVAEKNGRTKDALSFNALATSWPDIVDASRARPAPSSSQAELTYDEDD